MSERTTPPSIAPKKTPANRPARATDDGAQVPSGEATTSRPSNGEAPASVGERIRRTAAGVAGAARSAISPRPAGCAPRRRPHRRRRAARAACGSRWRASTRGR